MLLTISKTHSAPGSIAIGGPVGVLRSTTATYDLTIDQLEHLRSRLVQLANANVIRWSTSATSDTADDSAEGATVSYADALPLTTRIADPTVPLDEDTSALEQALNPVIFVQPTAERLFDVSNAPFSMRLLINKLGRGLFGVKIPAAAGWRGPNGTNLDYLLPLSSDQKACSYEVVIDVPHKIYYVRSLPRGWNEIMCPEPSASPGDTLDLFDAALSTYTGNGGQGFYQTGIARSDGVSFGAERVNNTRTQEDRGEGYGALLLLEPGRTNFCLQNQTIYSAGGVITAPWVAVNGNVTGVGAVAGSPKGDATVSRLTFAGADPTTGVKQAISGTPNNNSQMTLSGSTWARVTAGAHSVRFQWVRKDSSIVTSGDIALTTTWKRIDWTLLTNGLAGSTGQLEFRIINGSAGENFSLDLWRPQVEVGATPTSAILTVAASVARTADSAPWFAPDKVPQSFRTRGVSIQYAPDFTNVEQWQSVANHTLCSFDNDDTLVNSGRDWFLFGGVLNQNEVAGGAGRVACYASKVMRGIAAMDEPGPRFFSPPLTYARGVLLTMVAEAYRGALNLSGFLVGNGRHPLGGVWTWPGSSTAPLFGSFTVGGTPTGAPVAMAGRYGRYITTA